MAVNYPARTVTTCFDVSVVNVRASAAAKSRVSAPLAAAKERDASKVKKWRALCADGGLEFVPLSFEAQGAFGLGVQQLLHVARSALEEEQDLAVGGDCVHARDERTWLAPTEYQYRKQRLVAALARWNSRIVLSGLAALGGHHVVRAQLLATPFGLHDCSGGV